MPRFIVEGRPSASSVVAASNLDSVRHARTFSMGGRTFDVYIAADRRAFRQFAHRFGISTALTHG